MRVFGVQTPSSLEQAAKPLVAAQSVGKGKIWLLICGGAAGLFAATVLLENNKTFFPAISRANQAMAKARQGGGEAEEEGAAPTAGTSSADVDVEVQTPTAEDEAQQRNERAVLQGLEAARKQVLDEKSASR